MEQDLRITPCIMSTVYTSWSPLQACSELHLVYMENQLYMDGSSITEGTLPQGKGDDEIEWGHSGHE